MPATIEGLTLQLNAKLDGYTAQLANATTVTERSLQRINTAATETEKVLGRNRIGMQQLSYQLGDVAQGFALGVNPMVIFAQQGGQVVQALSLMGGEAKGLLGFLGGPWGLAISTAAVALTPFIAKLFDTRDAATEAGDALKQAIDRLNASMAQMTPLSNVLTEASGKVFNAAVEIGKLNREIASTQVAIGSTRDDRAAGYLYGRLGDLQKQLKAQQAIRQEAAQAAQDAIAQDRIAGAMIERNRARLSGSSGPQRSSSPSSPSRSRAANAEKGTDLAEQQKAADALMQQLALERQLGELRAQGTDEASMRADILEATTRIESQNTKLTKEQLDYAKQFATATIEAAYGSKERQKALYEWFDEAEKRQRELDAERKRAADDAARTQEQQIHTLAGLYTDAFRGGTHAIWKDFKALGLQVVAEVLARFTLAKLGSGGGGAFDLAGAIGSAVSHVLPGFGTPQNLLPPGYASGGSMIIGGRGGTDQNMLSLNNQPIARVSAGEVLNIANPRLMASGGQNGGVSVVRLELSGDIDARIQSVSGPVAIQVVRASAPALIDASANETMRRAGRPKM